MNLKVSSMPVGESTSRFPDREKSLAALGRLDNELLTFYTARVKLILALEGILDDGDKEG